MDTLPIGITGFYKSSKSDSPKVDFATIKKFVELLKEDAAFYQVGYWKPKNDSNYYVVYFRDTKATYQIGINAMYPYYAGISGSEDEEAAIEFYDLPKRVTKKIPKIFTELKADFLSQPILPKFTTALKESELEQIEYWETENIGNVIFNCYE